MPSDLGRVPLRARSRIMSASVVSMTGGTERMEFFEVKCALPIHWVVTPWKLHTSSQSKRLENPWCIDGTRRQRQLFAENGEKEDERDDSDDDAFEFDAQDFRDIQIQSFSPHLVIVRKPLPGHKKIAPSRLAKPPLTVLTVIQSTKPTPAFMPRVAAELVDLIISFLHPIPFQSGNGAGNFLEKSTANDVANCGLVCREWVPSSRRVLFYRVHVRRLNAHTFAKLFKKPQHLTFLPYIRELQFHRSEIVKNRWWTTIPLRIVKHLSGSGYSVPRLGHYPYMLACPQLPGITHLDIVADHSTLAEILRCVTSFPELETLRLWIANWTAMRMPDEPLRLAKTLHSLDIKCSSDVEHILSWIQSTNVHVSTLSLHIPQYRVEGWLCATRYIQHCASSLTSLSLTFLHPHGIPDLTDGFLRSNTQLRELTIQAFTGYAALLFTPIHLPQSLEIITFAIPAFFPDFEQVSSDSDSAIASHDSIRQLRIVYFGPYKVEEMGHLHSNLDEIPARMLHRLPLCAARGIVTESVAGRDLLDYYWGRR
ncbi:hypothetical protein DFH09DRAFT_1396711 [Mycena vulgaris]|nr:hypothetical protein DFH09DRAFT_1396711 [Mycena vulgaris]